MPQMIDTKLDTSGSMKPVFGMLLVGGGMFLLVALFNGTLKVPFGMIGGTNKTGLLGTGILANAPANLPGNQPIQTVKPNPNTLACPSGSIAYRASGGNIICVKQ
jgi:hypothetical protein